MRRRLILGFAAAAVVGGGVVLAQAPAAVGEVAPLVLTATPVPLDSEDPARQVVGQLRYLGGVVLKSPNPAFGGLSGLRAGRGGWWLSVSDTGNWVTFRTVERRGRLVGVIGGSIAPIRDEQGRPPPDKEAGDAEALEWDARTGEAVVGFEQDHRILTVRGIDPAKPATLRAAALSRTNHPSTKDWPANGGGEALVRLADAALLWIAEEPAAGGAASPVLRFDATGARAQVVTPPFGFRPTDAALLPGGDVLVVNRRFTARDGVAAVVTRVTPGDRMTGVEVARLAPPLTVDNFEAVAVTTERGRTYVWLLSDDNFFALQRTLLLKFELLSAASAAAPRP